MHLYSCGAAEQSLSLCQVAQRVHVSSAVTKPVVVSGAFKTSLQIGSPSFCILATVDLRSCAETTF